VGFFDGLCENVDAAVEVGFELAGDGAIVHCL